MNIIIAAVAWRASDTLTVFAVVVLIAASGFVALAETSLTRITKVKASVLAEQNRRGAKDLSKLIEEPGKFLNAILLTGLVFQLVAATLVGVIAARLFGALGVSVAIVFEVIVIFIVAEAIPKNYAVHHGERAALFSAPIVSLLVRFPLVRGASMVVSGITNALLKGQPYSTMGNVSEQELLAMADAAAEDEAIEDQEREIIASVIEFGDTVAREIMVPRVDIVAADQTSTIDFVLSLALDKGVSRLPIYDHNLDNITGIVMIKDLVRASRSGQRLALVATITRGARFVPETKPVLALLREMQAGKYHLVLVVDEYGGTAGLVAMEDLIEELVGDIVDEFDLEEDEVVEIRPGCYRVKATKSVDELNEEYSLSLPTGDWDTVGGLFLQLLEHLPKVGEEATSGKYALIAENVIRNRVVTIRLEIRDGPSGDSGI